MKLFIALCCLAALCYAAEEPIKLPKLTLSMYKKNCLNLIKEEAMEGVKTAFVTLKKCYDTIETETKKNEIKDELNQVQNDEQKQKQNDEQKQEQNKEQNQVQNDEQKQEQNDKQNQEQNDEQNKEQNDKQNDEQKQEQNDKQNIEQNDEQNKQQNQEQNKEQNQEQNDEQNKEQNDEALKLVAQELIDKIANNDCDYEEDEREKTTCVIEALRLAYREFRELAMGSRKELNSFEYEIYKKKRVCDLVFREGIYKASLDAMSDMEYCPARRTHFEL